MSKVFKVIFDDSLIVRFVANTMCHTVATPNDVLLKHKPNHYHRQCLGPLLIPAINWNHKRNDESHKTFQVIVISEREY
jgi:hypothetical protein